MNTGIIFAALTIVFFGSWAVPTRNLKIQPVIQAYWLTIGHLILSVVVFLLSGQSLHVTSMLLLPLLAGILWSLGIAAGYRGIRELGITRALGLWIPIIIIVSAFWGLCFFGEAAHMTQVQLLQTFAAVTLLVLAALAIIQSSRHEQKLGNVPMGILMSTILGVIHGSFFVLLKLSGLPLVVSFVPMTIGMVITMALIVHVRRLPILAPPTHVSRMLTAGFLLGAGNYTALLTIQYLGISRGYPLTQLGIIVNTLWGVLYFKEASNLKSRSMIAIGIALALIGAIFLNAART